MSTDDLIAEGIAAYNAGETREAQKVFADVIKQDKTNTTAWYYLGLAQSDPNKRRECMKRVLAIDPEHAEAQTALAELDTLDETPDNVLDMNDLRSTAKRPSAQGGVSVTLLSDIPGAPPIISADYVVEFAQGMAQRSVPVFMDQVEAVDSNATWWSLFLSVALTSFALGVLGVISYLVRLLRFELSVDVFSLIFPPLLTVLIGVVAVSAGCFLSHWYLTRQENSNAPLLEHSAGLVAIWIPASVALGVVFLLETVLLPRLDLFRGGVVTLEDVLFNGFPMMSAGMLVFTVLAGAVAGYALYLMHKHLTSVHQVDSRAAWIGAFIMVLVTSLVF